MGGALARPTMTVSDVAAIGITQQRETTVVWDRAPVCRSTTPSSGRTPGRRTSATSWARDAATALPGARPDYRIATYFADPKIRWILDNVDEARARAEAGDLFAGTIDTWLLWNLTGGSRMSTHRSDERLPDPADGSWRPCSGIRSCATRSACRSACCPRSARPQRSTARWRNPHVDGGGPHRRDPRRPAGCHLRPGVSDPRARRRTPTAPATSCC